MPTVGVGWQVTWRSETADGDGKNEEHLARLMVAL